MASGIVDEAAGSWHLFCGVTPKRKSVVAEAEHITHLVLPARLILLLPVLVRKQLPFIITHDLCRAERSRDLHSSSSTQKVINDLNAVPRLCAGPIGNRVHLRQSNIDRIKFTLTWMHFQLRISGNSVLELRSYRGLVLPVPQFVTEMQGPGGPLSDSPSPLLWEFSTARLNVLTNTY